MRACPPRRAHRAGVRPVSPPVCDTSAAGDSTCDGAHSAGTSCGHVGCCDDSPGKHATAHARDSGHPVLRSFEPGEGWFYDYETSEAYASGPPLPPPESHPAGAGSPAAYGPVVPCNWWYHQPCWRGCSGGHRRMVRPLV
ncbi:UBP-type zinc finger domain-containing protein [Streptomyces lydicus]|uniref:UBP-type zinc finger domain-containing protein n=1 Tax=Streptomyces lydicus TaxID=47763 RepID=UPI0036FEFA6C